MHTAESAQEVPNSEESDCIRTCLEGKDENGEAFSIIYKQYQPILVSFIMQRFHRQEMEAEDIVQETFILAKKNFSTLEEARAFKRWIHQIAVNQTKNRFRGGYSKQVSLNECQANSIFSRQPKPDDRLLQEELAEAVRSAVAALKPEFRQAVEDIEFGDMKYDEAAKLRNIPCNTVKTRRMRGMDQLHTSKKLRALFEQSC